jgi:DNA-binding response OmpR family regulator
MFGRFFPRPSLKTLDRRGEEREEYWAMARVLIVEDNTEVAEILHDALTEEGHCCEIARHADEACAILAASHPDLVVSDVVMPKGSGVLVKEAADAIGVPTLFITGDLAKITEFEDEGVVFLAKPFRIIEFIAAVTAALRSPDSRSRR